MPVKCAMLSQAAPWMRVARFRPAIDRRLASVLSSSNYILGEEVEAFEAAFATYIGAVHCTGVASGTDALALALRALGVGPGDEVISVALTASATAAAILQCGATLRFVDVNPRTRCLDVAHLAASITPKTAAVVPVHLYGHPVDMPAVMRVAERYHLAVVEDCAQAHGAHWEGQTVGSFGHAAAFSFYPTKNLGGVGDGGAVTTSDSALNARIRALRSYGWGDGQRISRELGWNSRLDELQAAILNVLLPELDFGNSERRALAAAYSLGLAAELDDRVITLPPQCPGSVYHQYAIETANRDTVRTTLAQEFGIGSAVHYWPALHQQTAYRACAFGPLPFTERIANEVISLPIQSEVVGGEHDRVIEAVVRSVRSCTQS